jgi:hypothetical protein
MAIEYDPKSNRFKVSYQAPFGGLDSTAFASAIDPHNFGALSNLINNANYLTPIGWEQVISQSMTAASGSYLGYIPVAESSTIGYIITTNSVIILSSDGAGGITYTPITPYAPAVATYGYFSYVVIEKQLIWTTTTWNEIWTFDTTTSVISLLTNFVGGGYLGVLDNQLINLGGVSNLDGLVPYRISWSAPGQYGQFQPFDVGSGTGSFSAGFNDLPSTSDVLTGIITTGSVAYIFRSQGITQMNITGNGTDPFQFNHLWASELGIGTVLPDTISQYGSMGAFVSDSGFYALGLNGIQEITGPAKELIYGKINNIASFAINSLLPVGIVTARCVPYLLSHPSTYYVIGILTSMTSAPTGVSPSANTYSFYAIDLANNNNTYDLGTLPVAVNSGIPSANAVGKLSFINRNYTSAPSPAPPPAPSFTDWENTTFYNLYNVYAIPDFSTGLTNLYSCTTSGVAPTTPNEPPGINAPAAIGDTVTYGSVVFTYWGTAIFSPATSVIKGQYVGLKTGTTPFFNFVGYICTQAGITGGSQSGWSTTPGAIINDGTAIWQCLGISAALLTSVMTPSGSSTYNIASNTEVVDPSNFLQQNTNDTVTEFTYTFTDPVFPHPTITVNYATAGAFSQTAAPTWNETTGGATNETKTLTTPLPAATWICLGAKPSPPTTLVGSNVAVIVPLFVAINNNDLVAAGDTLIANKLVPPTISNIGAAAFRKEQFKFGFVPTVSKVGMLASLIDTTQDGVIQVSVDGGLTFNAAFPSINITSGSGTNPANGVPDNLYSDGVQSLERPQLMLALSNVKVAEVFYQGTLADYDLI